MGILPCLVQYLGHIEKKEKNMIFEYGGIHDLPIEISNLTENIMHWLVFELPSRKMVSETLHQLDYPEAKEWSRIFAQTTQAKKIKQFMGEVDMCCYYWRQTTRGRCSELKRMKYTSYDLASRVEDYAERNGFQPRTISQVAWDVAALYSGLHPKKVNGESYMRYPTLSQTLFQNMDWDIGRTRRCGIFLIS